MAKENFFKQKNKIRHVSLNQSISNIYAKKILGFIENFFALHFIKKAREIFPELLRVDNFYKVNAAICF